jgi:hypothetical protein
MLAEVERIFSSAKRTILPDRSRLGDDNMNTWSCLNTGGQEG